MFYFLPYKSHFQVQPGDRYPPQLCNYCWNQCRSWSIFRNLANGAYRQMNPQPVVVPVNEIINLDMDESSSGPNAVRTEVHTDIAIPGPSHQVTTTANRGQPATVRNRNVRGRVHRTKPKQKKCRYCPKKYVRQSFLRIHERTHKPLAGSTKRVKKVKAKAISSGNNVVINNNYGQTR